MYNKFWQWIQKNVFQIKKKEVIRVFKGSAIASSGRVFEREFESKKEAVAFVHKYTTGRVADASGRVVYVQQYVKNGSDE